MCHPISWKVNFRPFGLRSRPEEHRGAFQSQSCRRGCPRHTTRSFREHNAQASRTQRDVWEEGPRRSFLPPGTGVEMNCLSGFKKKKKERRKKAFYSFSGMQLNGCQAMCPGTRKVAVCELRRPGLQTLRLTVSRRHA